MFIAEDNRANRAKHVSIYKYISGLKSFTFIRFIQLSLTVNIYILIALFLIMVGTWDCVCCGKRISSNDKRPVTMNSLRLFISARLFPSSVPDDCLICTTCLWMYKKMDKRVFFERNITKN
jgi:hypothetical protein